MYHDQYTRRRTADSFHDETLDGKPKTPDEWSWKLFLGLIIIQVTGRCLWASFGVISFFVLRDTARPWDLLWIPVTYSATWALAEPWVKFFCEKLPSPLEFTYVTVVGVAVSWFGVLIAVKCPLTIAHFVPLLGVLGGLGASFAVVGSESLALKHFPKRTGAVRTFGHAMTSSSVFSLPILSFCLLNNFGEHGGLLLHGCVLIQSFIGAALLRNAKWNIHEFEPRERSYAFRESTDDPWPGMISERERIAEPDDRMPRKSWRNPATEVYLDEPDFSYRPEGVAVTLPNRRSMKQKFIQAKRKKRKRFIGTVDILPKIVEVNENPGNEKDECITDLKKSLEELHRISQGILEARVPATNILQGTDSANVNVIKKPPRTFEHYRRINSEENVPSELESTEVCDSDVSTTATCDVTSAAICDVTSTGVRGCEAVCNRDEVVTIPDVALDSDSEDETDDSADDSDGDDQDAGTPLALDLYASCPPNGCVVPNPRPASPFYTSFITSDDILMSSPTSQFRSRFCCFLSYLQYGMCGFAWRRCWLAQPLLLPAVFLMFSLQFSVLGFMALTPMHVYRVVADVSDEDSAFTVCLMGFTWLSFVIASPCFSTVRFTNHHVICLVSLSIASLSCYLLSEAQDQDEMSLYSCLFGVSQGISQMTAHSVLKLSLGSTELDRMRLPLSVCVPLLMALTVTAFGSLEWFQQLRNSYKLFAGLLCLSALVWLVQWCTTSVRRSQNGIRWSRRRRIS